MASEAFETYRQVLEDLARYESEREKERSMANNMSEEAASELFQRSSEKLMGIPHQEDPPEGPPTFAELPEAKRAAFERQAAAWIEDAPPKRQPGEGNAGYILRCRQEKADRSKVIRDNAAAAYAETLKPSQVERFVTLMGADSAKANAASAAKKKAAEEEAEALKRRQRKAEQIRRIREG